MVFSGGPSITGCSGVTVSAGAKNNMSSCESGRDYKQSGVKASTTNNIYGIYDMSGGSWERAMAAIASVEGIFQAASSGFSEQPNSKYFDLYPNNTASTDFSKGKLGDATKEVRKKDGTNANGWYGDYGYFPYTAFEPWFTRGGHASDREAAGLVRVIAFNCEASSYNGARAVLTP